MSLADMQRAVTSLCFAATEPSEALLGELGERSKWLMYRELVRNRLRKELRHALRRTCKALPEDVFERAFVQHLDRDPPRTRFFREVVHAFAETAIPMWRGDANLPAWIADLASYELALWDVSDLDAQVIAPIVELAFDRVAVLTPALQLLELEHAVHRAQRLDGSYEKLPSRLCVYRPADDAPVKTWVLEPTTFELLQIFRASEIDVTAAIRRACEDTDQTLDAAYVERLCGTLAELIEARMILGCR
jgi:hypothetical protein